MKISKEHQCIKLAAELRVKSAKHQLAELKKRGLSVENPLAGFAWKIDWEDEPAKRTKQVLLLPVAILVVMFLAAMIPVVYAIELYNVWQQKQKLKQRIKVNSLIEDSTLPASKTLESLWRIHGLHKHGYSFEEQSELLEKWIENLYSKEILLGRNLCEELKTISSQRVKADFAFYMGESDIRCIFGPPIDTLVSTLSEELPTYNYVSSKQSG